MVARDIGSGWDDLRIYPLLLDFVDSYRAEPTLFRSFAVVFEGRRALSEAKFEAVHVGRVPSRCPTRTPGTGTLTIQRVSEDPHDHAFLAELRRRGVLHRGAAPRRQPPGAPVPRACMIFNLHDQFERLRLDGTYDKLRRTILSRDEALAGSQNPMLARFGEVSEARQYSGRAVDAAWACPFRPAGR